MTTVREIAEFAGVSKSTVSLVLNNKPGVSAEMRQTVLSAVNELKSLQLKQNLPTDDPNAPTHDMSAQGLSMMVLHPPVLRSSYVFSKVLQGIQSAAEMFNVQLRLVMNDPQASDQHVSHIYLADDNLRPDGVLVFGAQQHEPLLEKVVEHGVPCVVLGREAQKYHVSGITRDEQAHAYQLTQHLLDLGHRSIAFVGGEVIYDYTHNRVAGYRQALIDAGLADNEWVCLGNGAEGTYNILENAPDVTALIYVNDSYASEGLAVLHDRNIAIPDQLSVASFDNTDVAYNHNPPVTSIAYNHFKEGQWAVKMLVEQIHYDFIDTNYLVCKADLLKRASTSAPIKT